MLSCTSVCCCLLVTCWERADLLALVCGCHFTIGILGKVWYLIVSIPDLCPLSHYLKGRNINKNIRTIFEVLDSVEEKEIQG